MNLVVGMFGEWTFFTNVSMPNPDVLELLPVSHTVGDLDLKQSFPAVASECRVIFSYWRHKTFSFRDCFQKWNRVCMRMTGNEPMKSFRDV